MERVRGLYQAGPNLASYAWTWDMCFCVELPPSDHSDHFPIIPLKNSLVKMFGSHNMTTLYPNSHYNKGIFIIKGTALYQGNGAIIRMQHTVKPV